MGVEILTEEDVRAIVREEQSRLIGQNFHAVNNKLNLKEAAKYLNLPVPTFRMHQHKIGGVKIGRGWMFTKEELDRYEQKHRRKTEEEIRETV